MLCMLPGHPTRCLKMKLQLKSCDIKTFVSIPSILFCHILCRTAQPEPISESAEHFFSFIKYTYFNGTQSSILVILSQRSALITKLSGFLCERGIMTSIYNASTDLKTIPFLDLKFMKYQLLLSIVHFCHLLVKTLIAQSYSTIFLTKLAYFIQL